jgi:hypothetical protein
MNMSRASSLRPIEEKRQAIMAISLHASSVPMRIRVVRILKYSSGVKVAAVVPSYKPITYVIAQHAQTSCRWASNDDD